MVSTRTSMHLNWSRKDTMAAIGLQTTPKLLLFYKKKKSLLVGSAGSMIWMEAFMINCDIDKAIETHTDVT